jgi:hypothetical protein
MQSPVPSAADSAPPEKQAPAAPSAQPVAKKSESVAVPVGGVVGGTVAPSAQFAPPARRSASNLAGVPAAGEIEASAQQARHAGEYSRAASLYRQAAALRERDQDPAAAAWNLAHAVECLSAAGQFDDARTVRDDLARAYPSETSALSAARRALREVEPATPAAR